MSVRTVRRPTPLLWANSNPKKKRLPQFLHHPFVQLCPQLDSYSLQPVPVSRRRRVCNACVLSNPRDCDSEARFFLIFLACCEMFVPLHLDFL